VIEVERKFLVPKAPEWLDRCRFDQIEQAYLAITPDWEFRVRRKGGETLLTVKHGSGARRTEVEVEIAEEQFQSLIALSEAAIAKRRHYVEGGDVTIEVDTYEGDLEGLVVAEVEFDSDAAAGAFDPPAWFGDEVTGDKRWRNQQLALNGAPDGASDRVRTSAR
jgi:adenylate cyclase